MGAGKLPSPTAKKTLSDSQPDREHINDLTRVKELHSQLNKLAKKSLLLAREAGEILSRLKDKTPHGGWEAYVEKELGMHPRTASNYMRIWRKTSSFDKIGEFLKSESVSEMGLREALDHFAKPKQQTSTKSDDGSPALKPCPGPKSQAHATLSLADGSQLSFKKIGWVEGPIPKVSLENSLIDLASQDEMPADKKVVARQQRFVAEIANTINRCSGKAKSDVAMKIAQPALKIVSNMISESAKPSQQR